MNVYDFDGTIYSGDSSVDFYLFTLKKYPFLSFLIPFQVFYSLLFLLHLISRKKFKEKFFIFLKFTPDLRLSEFWDEHQYKIKPWYLKQRKNSDIIISASPEFLLRESSVRLDFQLIATKMSSKTGKITGENCWGAEKVLRFKSEFKSASIHQFYTDSKSDAPLKTLAKESFIVKDNDILPFD